MAADEEDSLSKGGVQLALRLEIDRRFPVSLCLRSGKPFKMQRLRPLRTVSRHYPKRLALPTPG